MWYGFELKLTPMSYEQLRTPPPTPSNIKSLFFSSPRCGGCGEGALRNGVTQMDFMMWVAVLGTYIYLSHNH
jgi:hypothetical protein